MNFNKVILHKDVNIVSKRELRPVVECIDDDLNYCTEFASSVMMLNFKLLIPFTENYYLIK